jgi:uncharacterized membrane protein YoaK (UPF0700 family)
VNLWAALSMFFAVVVAAGMCHYANRMKEVPHRVRLLVAVVTGAAMAYAFSPMWVEGFTWTDAAFSGAFALYVWLDRRKPA